MRKSLREQAVVLIDAPAHIHRWYHRWSYTNQKMPIDYKKFTVVNAKTLIALAHGFDPAHLEKGILSPMVSYNHTPRHNKIIFCFDHGDGGRSALYPGYKKKRSELERAPELKKMFALSRKVFAEEPPETQLILPDAIFSSSSDSKNINLEADDIIATIALSQQEKKAPTIIISHDFDLFQLVDNAQRCFYFDIRTHSLVSEKGVMERIGVPPILVQDYKSLAGDSSDSIPGIPGIGPTRAIQLLNTYGNLDTILSQGVEKQTGRVGDLLRKGVKSAELSRQLVQFRIHPKISKIAEKFLES